MVCLCRTEKRCQFRSEIKNRSEYGGILQSFELLKDYYFYFGGVESAIVRIGGVEGDVSCS